MAVEGRKAHPWNPDRPQLLWGHRILLKGYLDFQTARDTKGGKGTKDKDAFESGLENFITLG